MRQSFTAALILAAILVVACGGGTPAAAPAPAPDAAPTPPPQDTQAAPTAAVAPSPQPETTAPQEPEVMVGNKVGNRAPDFRVTTFDGATVTPAALEGKPYILYFFATWWPTCRAEFRHLKALHPPYADSVQVLAVSIDPGDDADKIRSYQDQNDFRWPMALTSREMLVAYGVRQQSTKFAIDADGIITYTRGPGNAGEDAWASILEDAAPGASTAQAPSTAPPASAAPSPAATAPPPAPTAAPRPSPAPPPTAAPQVTASPAPPPPPPAPTAAPPSPTPTATPEPEVAVGNKVGNRAPDFQVTTVDGVTVTPADLDGKPYILYFFATW